MVMICISPMKVMFSTFYVLGHLYVFFGKMFIQVYCPFLNWATSLFAKECMNSMYFFGYYPFWDMLFASQEKLILEYVLYSGEDKSQKKKID